MICSHARLNPRYFYQEFASREGLLGHVHDRHIQAVTDAVGNRDRTGAARPARPPSHRGLRTFLDGVLADPRGARINYFEMVGVSPQLEEKRRDILRAYADLVAQPDKRNLPKRPRSPSATTGSRPSRWSAPPTD